MALPSLRLIDYSDRELLLVMRDLADGDGWVGAQDVADRLGIEHENPRRCVSTRLAWLTRYGALEKELLRDERGEPLTTRTGQLKFGQRWRMTNRGRMLAMGELNKRQEDMLERISDDQMLVVTRWAAQRQRRADDVAGTLIRREWRHTTHPLRELY